jgi:hypothetical protein
MDNTLCRNTIITTYKAWNVRCEHQCKIGSYTAAERWVGATIVSASGDKYHTARVLQRQTQWQYAITPGNSVIPSARSPVRSLADHTGGNAKPNKTTRMKTSWSWNGGESNKSKAIRKLV